MGRQVSEKTYYAERLLSTPHPRSPSGLPYTKAEAAKEAGIALPTLYHHLNKKRKEDK